MEAFFPVAALSPRATQWLYWPAPIEARLENAKVVGEPHARPLWKEYRRAGCRVLVCVGEGVDDTRDCLEQANIILPDTPTVRDELPHIPPFEARSTSIIGGFPPVSRVSVSVLSVFVVD